MRKATLLAILGLFVSGNALSSEAMACGWGASKSASSEAQQTVMTDPAPVTTDKPTQPKG